MGGSSLLAACGDDATSTGTGGQGGGGAGGTGGVIETPPGCEAMSLPEIPEDTRSVGPFAVGAKTVKVGDLTVEVFFPAKAGSEGSKAKKQFDIREHLPDSEMGKIPDTRAPIQTCECYDELPLDSEHGPYPAIVFVHGTAGFRTQSLELTQHWASRGFIVFAADHPGLNLRDLLGSICGADAVEQDLGRDIAALVKAIKSPTGELAFLGGKLDSTRIGMSGHSAGGSAIKGQGSEARVLIPMAAGGVDPGEVLSSTLVLGGKEDTVVDSMNQVSGYESSPQPKRLAIISPAGHLTFSSLCFLENADGENLVELGKATGVCGLGLADVLFDCEPTYLPAEKCFEITRDLTAAALEEQLQRRAWRLAQRCNDAAPGSRYVPTRTVAPVFPSVPSAPSVCRYGDIRVYGGNSTQAATPSREAWQTVAHSHLASSTHSR
jgi:hypothetical protein